VGQIPLRSSFSRNILAKKYLLLSCERWYLSTIRTRTPRFLTSTLNQCQRISKGLQITRTSNPPRSVKENMAPSKRHLKCRNLRHHPYPQLSIHSMQQMYVQAHLMTLLSTEVEGARYHTSKATGLRMYISSVSHTSPNLSTSSLEKKMQHWKLIEWRVSVASRIRNSGARNTHCSSQYHC
jgi:hypothetical protein